MARCAVPSAASGQPFLRPATHASATPAIAALICTTVPPAKSSEPRRASQPVGENTQCATGAYTSTDHVNANTTNGPNLILSADDPVINPTVMIANII